MKIYGIPLKLIACVTVLIATFPVFSGCASARGENRLLKLLDLFPESAVNDGCFFLIDYERIWEKNKVVFPDNVPNVFDILESSSLLDDDNIDGSGFYFTSLFTGYVQKNFVGYDITDVTAEINNGVRDKFMHFYDSEYSFAKPELKVAAIGTFNPKATEKALEYRDEWPEWAVRTYSEQPYEGVTIHYWTGETPPDDSLKNAPPYIRNGELPSLAVTDDRLFVGESVDNVKGMIDANQKEAGTLADVPEYALVAQGLDRLGVYVAIIGDTRLTNRIPEFMTDYPLEPVLTFGTGYGQDEQGTYMALVLVHESEALANANSELLPQRFSYYGQYLNSGPGREIYDTKVEVEGRALLVRLYTNDSYFWHYWFLRGYPLLYSGE